jgi:hypothetical protein
MMLDTEHVLEQMRAANPAPSLEQLAVDDLDRVRAVVARERSATTTRVKEQPQTRPERLIPRRGLHPVLVAGLAFVLVLGTLGATVLLFRGAGEMATAGFTCPPGSTPDQPGPADQPRPRWLSEFSMPPDFNVTFDPGSGRALILAPRAFWMFDVCTNTWTAAPRPGEVGFHAWTATPRLWEIGLVTGFVYDVDSDRAIAFAEDRAVGAQVWAYGPDRQRWTRKNNFIARPAAVQAVYDPVTGLVVVRAILTSQMWTYDVDTDTWTDVDQGATLPPSAEDAQLLTYDASVDRLILYVNSEDKQTPTTWEEDEPTSSTWEFDIRAGRWEKQATNTPNLPGGWGPSAEGFVFDESNQVSVIYAGGTQPYVAIYDASEHSWTELWTPWDSGPAISGADPSRDVVLGPAMTYDPVNERILVAGGPENGVFAFDVATREWITLLEPITE